MHTLVPADHSASPSVPNAQSVPALPSVPDAPSVSTIDLSNIPDDGTLSEYCIVL